MERIPNIALGSEGLVVPAVGPGCTGMSTIAGNNIYGEANKAQAIATIHRSLESGGKFVDNADLYGPLENERLFAMAIKGNRDKYIIATKFGFEINDTRELTWVYDGAKDDVRKAVERSLKNFGTDHVELHYWHRLVPNTPIE